MSKADPEDATAPADMSPPVKSRTIAVAGHDLKPPLHVAMLSMELAVKQGVPAAAMRSAENRDSIFSVELPRYLPGAGGVQRTEAI